MFATIYGLIDPIDHQLRYVGKTVAKLKSRHHGHIKDLSNSKKAIWIRCLLEVGLKPEIIEIEVVDIEEWREVEQFWIQYFKAIGCKLTNSRAGVRERHLSGVRLGFSKPERIAKMIETRNSSEYRELTRLRGLQKREDPQFVTAFSIRMQEMADKRYGDPEWSKWYSGVLREALARPEEKKRRSAASKKAMNSISAREHLGKVVMIEWKKPGVRESRKQAMREAWIRRRARNVFNLAIYLHMMSKNSLEVVEAP